MARKTVPRPSDAPQLSLGYGAPSSPAGGDVCRVFLGWSRPCLVASAEVLTEMSRAEGAIDLGHLIVVTPVARAGARLLELLVDRAESLDRPLLPPRVITAGFLADLLVPPDAPPAHPAVRALLWALSVRDASSEARDPVLPSPPAHDDWSAWLRLGSMLDRLDTELEGADLTFASVVERAASLEAFRGPERWVALASLGREAGLRLAALGFDDPRARRLASSDEVRLRPPAERIVLVGTADLNRTTRRLLGAVAPHVTSLIHAPESLAARFDRFGCIDDGAWDDGPVGAVEVTVVEGPAEQAAHVASVLASLGSDATLEDVVIGVPDVEAIPYLEDTLEHAGVPVRNAAGRPICRTGPYLLLEAIAEDLESGEFGALAALARHPDLARWMADGTGADWSVLLDAYQAEHVPRTVGDDWLGEPGVASSLRDRFHAVESLIGELRGPPRPLANWAEPLARLVAAVYGQRDLDPNLEADRVVIAVCGALRTVLRAFHDLPETVADAVDGAGATRLVLSAVAEATIPETPDREAIDLLGWLELPNDDAASLIVTGFNEGFVPGSVNADAFLPDGLRAHLGLVDNRHRFARDAYALSAMMAWRERVCLIAPRRSASGEPLSLSRLALAGEADQVARRLLRFYRPEGATACVAAGRIQPKSPTPNLPVPRPAELREPMEGLRVTAFRDYLACPYRFYLRHVEKLARTDDRAVELDARLFGILAHDVLQDFGTSDQAACTEPSAIATYLDAALSARAVERFGTHAHPAVRVQVEQLRERLRAFAEWQARWAQRGNRILHTELPVTGRQAPFVVDGHPFYLRGRIDRIDRNEETGALYLLDYKFSAKAREPDKAHRDRQVWVDLQLPLYRHLATAAGLSGPYLLGYVCLPRDAVDVAERIADWSEEDLAAADATAQEVVRKLREGVFWPPSERPPAFSDDYASICQQGQLRASSDVDDDAGEESV